MSYSVPTECCWAVTSVPLVCSVHKTSYTVCEHQRGLSWKLSFGLQTRKTCLSLYIYRDFSGKQNCCVMKFQQKQTFLMWLTFLWCSLYFYDMIWLEDFLLPLEPSHHNLYACSVLLCPKLISLEALISILCVNDGQEAWNSCMQYEINGSIADILNQGFVEP